MAGTGERTEISTKEMTYPIHPIAKIYPPLPAEEFAKLREHIRAHGLQNAIVLYEEQVLDGSQRQQACEEAHIEPRYDRPVIKDLYAYVTGQNERRRQLNETQLGVVGEKMATLQWGTNQFEKKEISAATSSRKSIPQIAKLVGTAKATIGKVRYAKTHGIPELYPAMESGKLAATAAKDIAHLPKEKQAAALEVAITKPSRAGRPKKLGPGLSPDEATKDAECLEYINRPSVFPMEAHIPQGDGMAEKRLRQAIKWLREHEPLIATFGSGQCDELLRCTNAIASYRDNWFHTPRLDGEIDPRIMEWQQTLWRKRLRQQERIELQKKLRHRSQLKLAPVKRKVRLPFEDRFDNFWSVVESYLKTFRHSEQRQIVKAFRQKLEEFFSEISAERNGSGRVADNSDSETEITANNIETK